MRLIGSNARNGFASCAWMLAMLFALSVCAPLCAIDNDRPGHVRESTEQARSRLARAAEPWAYDALAYGAPTAKTEGCAPEGTGARCALPRPPTRTIRTDPLGRRVAHAIDRRT